MNLTLVVLKRGKGAGIANINTWNFTQPENWPMSFLFHFLSTTYFAHCLKKHPYDDQLHVACSVEEQERIEHMCEMPDYIGDEEVSRI